MTATVSAAPKTYSAAEVAAALGLAVVPFKDALTKLVDESRIAVRALPYKVATLLKYREELDLNALLIPGYKSDEHGFVKGGAFVWMFCEKSHFESRSIAGDILATVKEEVRRAEIVSSCEYNVKKAEEGVKRAEEALGAAEAKLAKVEAGDFSDFAPKPEPEENEEEDGEGEEAEN